MYAERCYYLGMLPQDLTSERQLLLPEPQSNVNR